MYLSHPSYHSYLVFQQSWLVANWITCVFMLKTPSIDPVLPLDLSNNSLISFWDGRDPNIIIQYAHQVIPLALSKDARLAWACLARWEYGLETLTWNFKQIPLTLQVQYSARWLNLCDPKGCHIMNQHLLGAMHAVVDKKFEYFTLIVPYCECFPDNIWDLESVRWDLYQDDLRAIDDMYQDDYDD